MAPWRRKFSRLNVLFICDGTAVEHRSLLNRSGICDGINRCNSEHRKMRAKQQHVCKEMNQYTNNTNRKWFLSFSIEWTIGANLNKKILINKSMTTVFGHFNMSINRIIWYSLFISRLYLFWGSPPNIF